jgi:DNA-binding transcriptional LysR family regulator
MAVDRRRTYHKRDRLKQLRTFCWAAKLESFVQAAAQLGLSPPAVSLHVRQLEHELQCVLFERGGSGISLTSAGETAYALAAPLVNGMDGLPDDLMARPDPSVSGRLSVAASKAAAAFFLPAYIKAFRDRYPGASVRVRSCLVREGVKLLRDNEVELVFGARDTYPEEDMEYRELRTYDIALITPLDHPLAGRSKVSPEEIREWPAILPLTGTYSRRFESAVAERLGIDGEAAIVGGGWESIKRYVERGLGISAMPTICISKNDRVSVIAFEEHFPSGSLGVFMDREKTLTPLARCFLQLVIPNPPDSSPPSPNAHPP